jgi:hypothetical protein
MPQHGQRRQQIELANERKGILRENTQRTKKEHSAKEHATEPQTTSVLLLISLSY